MLKRRRDTGRRNYQIRVQTCASTSKRRGDAERRNYQIRVQTCKIRVLQTKTYEIQVLGLRRQTARTST